MKIIIKTDGDIAMLVLSGNLVASSVGELTGHRVFSTLHTEDADARIAGRQAIAGDRPFLSLSR